LENNYYFFYTVGSGMIWKTIIIFFYIIDFGMAQWTWKTIIIFFIL